MRRLLAALLALVSLAAPAAMAAPVNAGHVEAELVAQEAAAVPGGTVYVALRQKLAPGWHSYWRNPGDSGVATSLTWTLPPGWRAGDIVWATPRLFIEGQPPVQLAVYGYEGEVLLPVPIEVPASARSGETVRLTARAAFLVCAEICVPEEAEVTLDLPVAANAAGLDRRWGAAVGEALARAPRPAGLAAVFAPKGEGLALAITGSPLAGQDMARARFFPFTGDALANAAAQPIERGPEGLTLTLTPGGAFKAGPGPTVLEGVLDLGHAAYEVRAVPGAPPPGASGLGAPPPAGDLAGLPLALLFAFLGGLILNLMPCVFPVLSMKAAALAGHAHETRAARAQGLAYLAGVLATFLALAGGLIALKAAGAAIGWGFQLQSPAVVAVLALVMLLVALNLSGVFEAGTSLQGAGGSLASRQGLAGAFFTGVLAVVVAAPCTAPFMAPAIGYAMTQSAVAALAVFGLLGLGLASPFVALSFAPALLSRLPRPGPWMETLRRVLAFPMYGAVAWLVWVLAQQTAPLGLAKALTAGVLVAFAAWLWGLAQKRTRPSPGLRGLAMTLALVSAVIVALVGMDRTEPAAAPATGGAELASQPWSPRAVAAARAEGKPVLVNFTAAWCVTCQVNERVALATAPVAEAIKRTGAVYLKGDWTRRDADIAAALAEHGRAGVPLYLVYPADGGPPAVLPQLLTPGMVVEALETAAR